MLVSFRIIRVVSSDFFGLNVQTGHSFGFHEPESLLLRVSMEWDSGTVIRVRSFHSWEDLVAYALKLLRHGYANASHMKQLAKILLHARESMGLEFCESVEAFLASNLGS